jgi:Uncharacterised nucleotidyltransferase
MLIAAARPRAPDPASLPSFDALDWDRLRRLAAHQRLEGLLHRLLGRLDGAVPARQRDELRFGRVLAVARELAARRQLKEVGGSLADAGVAAVALKGAALIEMIYTESGLRPMVDLDLLVEPHLLDRADLALAAAGYRPHPLFPAPLLAVHRQGEHHHSVPLAHRDRGLSVELHGRLIDGIDPASTSGFIARSRASARGRHRLPDQTDLLLHLAVHFAIDRRRSTYGALGQLADMGHVIDGGQVDWDLLTGRAREIRLEGAVSLAFGTLDRLGLALVPPRALAALGAVPLRPASYGRLISDRVLTTPGRTGDPEVPPSLWRFVFFPGRDYMRARYGLTDAHLPRLYLERARVALGIVPGRIAPSVRHVLIPGRDYLRRRYELPEAPLGRLYLKRVRDAVGRRAPRRIALNRELDRVMRAHRTRRGRRATARAR